MKKHIIASIAVFSVVACWLGMSYLLWKYFFEVAYDLVDPWLNFFGALIFTPLLLGVIGVIATGFVVVYKGIVEYFTRREAK